MLGLSPGNAYFSEIPITDRLGAVTFVGMVDKTIYNTNLSLHRYLHVTTSMNGCTCAEFPAVIYLLGWWASNPGNTLFFTWSPF